MSRHLNQTITDAATFAATLVRPSDPELQVRARRDTEIWLVRCKNRGTISTSRLRKERILMPEYVLYAFLCQDCNKEFTQILYAGHLEMVDVVCPQCGTNRVTPKVAALVAAAAR